MLITHLHVDHSADLVPLVNAGHFSSRARDLPVYGPTGARDWPSLRDWFREEFAAPEAPYRYLADAVTPGSASWVWRAENLPATPGRLDTRRVGSFTLTSMGVHHGPVPALAWRVDVAGCRIVFTGDTDDAGGHLAGFARNADLLVADHALPQTSVDEVALRLHLRPDMIGSIAARAHVKALLLSHRMRRSLGHEAESTQAIRQHYAGRLEFAEDGAIIAVGPPDSAQ